MIGNNNAIKVTGPNGFSQLATFVSIDNPTNGTPRTVTYKITAPGGTWDGIDTGHYKVADAGEPGQGPGRRRSPRKSTSASSSSLFRRSRLTNTNDSGPGSLRDAINAGQPRSGRRRNPLRPNVLQYPTDINLASPLPTIPSTSGNLTITGPGVANLKVDAGGQFRVFDSTAPELTLSNFEVAGGLGDSEHRWRIAG